MQQILKLPIPLNILLELVHIFQPLKFAKLNLVTKSNQPVIDLYLGSASLVIVFPRVAV